MLLLKPHRALVALWVLILGAAPVAHAAGVQASAQAGNGIAHDSDRVESREGGATLLLAGHVVVHVPASMPVNFESDRVSHKANGAEVFEGGVNLTIEQSRIVTARATVERAANGDAVISMDQAELTQQR